MLELRGVEIADTFAEAFTVAAARLVVTAESAEWARIAGTTATGNATSVIACDCEAGIERELSPDETPDGRPGVALLFFGFSRDGVAAAVQGRTGQCLLTCPTTACFDGLPDGPPDKRIPLGKRLRYFGDGFQQSKQLDGRRYWRIPVMDGEFVCEDECGTLKGVAGGNLILCGVDQATALAAATAAASAMRGVRDVILPFPGGLVRSGSKVGSKYKGLKASTNDAYCPTLRGATRSDLPEGCGAVYEIVIDGLSFEAVQAAMRVGLHAAVTQPGVLRITAGNYGGKLGKHHFHLRDLVGAP
jgi:formylmethanofuran--tetrahydromethanopterin N-formyltransferase